jgi:hypothetical protein
MSPGAIGQFSGLLRFGTWTWIAVTSVAWVIGVAVVILLFIAAERAFAPPGRGRDSIVEMIVEPSVAGLIFSAILAGGQLLAFGRKLGSGWRWMLAAIVWWTAGLLSGRFVADRGVYWLIQGVFGLRAIGIVVPGIVAVIVPWLVLRPGQPWALRWCLTNAAATIVGGAVSLVGAGIFGFVLASPDNGLEGGVGFAIGLCLGGPIYAAITSPAARRIAAWSDNPSCHGDSPAQQRPESM